MVIIRWISSEEELAIRYLLLSNRDADIKLGLIRICEFYQKGKRFRRANEVHSIVKGFVYDQRTEVERWALKALVEFRDPADVNLIESRLRLPPADEENFSWVVSAYFAAASEAQIEKAIDENLIPLDGLGMLACHYSGRGKLAKGRFPFINIDASDAITLKWAALTIATNRASGDIFLPKFDQDEQLVALNRHHHDDVAQYSLYAMLRSTRLKFSDCSISLQEIHRRQPNIRRWYYRLLCKDQKQIIRERDFIQDVIRSESDPKSREGLAVGLRNSWFDGLEGLAFDWLAKESDPDCEIAILEHMAQQSTHIPQYGEAVVHRFEKGERGGLLRTRLKDAASGTALFNALRKIEYSEDAAPELFDQGGLIVVNNTQNFNNKGPVTIASNSVGGNASVGNAQIAFTQQDLELLKTLRRLAEEPAKNAPAGTVAAIDKVLQDPSQKNGSSLLEKIKAWTSVAGLGAEIISNVQPAIELLKKGLNL